MRSILLSFIVLCLGFSANAQLNFSIRVGSRTIGKDQSLQVEYSVTNADALTDFKEPSFSDWEVLSGPMYSQQQMITNGKVDKTTAYIYILQPKRLGSLVLPGTSVIANNKRLQCAPVNITVVKEAVQPPQPSTQNLPNLFDEMTVDPEDRLTLTPGENVENKIRQLVFIRAEASKTKCYAGEPIQVTYKLFTALRPDLQVAKQPAFSGASVIELPFDDFPQVTEIGGKRYRVYTFRRVQLTPLQQGNLVLEPATVKVTLEYFTAHDRSMRSATVNISNNPGTIAVSAPPKLNGQEYDGPIGEFSLALKADNDTLPADATNNLIIELSGQGNFQNMKTPAIAWPAGVQHYDETTSEELEKQSFPVQGRKLIKIPFVVSRKGRIEIPPVQMTVFNPSSNQFETLTSNSLSLIISDAVKNENIQSGSQPITNTKYLWLIPVIALIAGFIFIVSNKKTKKEPIVIEEPKAEIAEEKEDIISPEQLIRSQLTTIEYSYDQREWLSMSRQVLKDALLLNGQTISEHEFVILEQLHKTRPQLFERYTSVVKTINEALYAPIPLELNRNEIISETKAIVQELIG